MASDETRGGTPVEEVMKTYDAGNPLPPPPPLCGQVWCWPDVREGPHLTVGRVDRGLGSFVRQSLIDTCEDVLVWWTPEWPPPGAVLVAGPGSPWADTRGDR